MAALNFPPSPSTNQIYTANGKSWRFDGTSWKTFYVLGVQGGGTGNTSYSLGDILVGAGTSILTLPVGANKSRKATPSQVPSSEVSEEKIPSRARSEVGLVIFAGVNKFRPRAVPAIILIFYSP